MKTLWNLRCVVAAAATLIVASTMPGQSPPVRATTSVDSAVYAALIEAVIRPRVDTLVVRDSTISFPAPGGGVAWRMQYDSIPPDLPARLLEVSRTVRPTSSLALPQPVRLITRTELREVFAGDVRDAWEKFYRRYPKQRQFLEFTPVAYSADSTEALVYYQHHCGGLCGGGNAVWLERGTKGRWEVRKMVAFWVS